MLTLTSIVLASAFALTPAEGRSQRAKPAGGGVAGASCGCPGDFDSSGNIDGADLAQLLGGWGEATGDLDGSGSTDASDLAILLGGWGPCFSVPSNDLCENPLPIAEGQTPFCTVGANDQGPPFTPGSSCIQFGYDSIESDVWYTITPIGFGTLTASTCGTSWDTRLAAYAYAFPSQPAGCPSASFSLTTVIACNDDNPACGLTSEISFNVLPGSEYKLRVGGYDGFSGEGVLNLEFTSIGQTCETAADLSVIASAGETYYGTTLDNDPDTDISPCASGDTVCEWIKVVSTCPFSSGSITVSTCNPDTDFDTVISVWKAGPNGCLGQYVGCNDDFAHATCQIGALNRKSELSFQSDPSQTFYIRVAGYQGARGNFALHVTENCD